MSHTIDLSGRVAVVTGAAQGIGKAVAAALCGAGAAVALVDRNAEGAQDAAQSLDAGDRAIGLGVDISDEAAVAAAWKSIAERFGGLDILVNAAGVISPNVPADQAEMSDFDRVISVNLKGILITAKHAYPYLKARRMGSIVNLSSQAALLSLPNQAIYTASKGGVTTLTRSLAIDWARDGIRVNAIAPTFIRTPMAEPMLADPAVLRASERRIPLGRVGMPEDIGNVALFLASDMSSLMTGQTLAVDGGWSIGEPGLDLK